MRLKTFFLASACAVTVALTLVPQPVQAWRATEVTQRSVLSAVRQTRDAARETRDEVNKSREEINDVRREVRDSADRIIEALKAHAGEQSAYQDKQIEASRRMRDAEQQNEAQRLRDEFRAKAESGDFDPSPDICLLADLFRGGGSASTNPGQSPIGTEGVRNTFTDMYDAPIEEVQSGGTRLARFVVDEQDEVLSVSDVLSFSTIENDPRELESLVRRLIDPLPPAPVLNPDTPEGVTREALRRIRQTRNSATGEVLAMVLNMSQPVQPVNGAMNAYIEDIADYNRDVPSEISELQALDIRTLRHYAPSPERVNTRSAFDEAKMLEQVLDAIAINSRIAYLQLELDRRRAVVETQILSALVND